MANFIFGWTYENSITLLTVFVTVVLGLWGAVMAYRAIEFMFGLKSQQKRSVMPKGIYWDVITKR